MSTKTHLRDLTYENKPTRTRLRSSLTRSTYETCLRELTCKESSTRTHLQNLPTRTPCIDDSECFFCIHYRFRVLFLRTLTISSILSPCIDDSECFFCIHCRFRAFFCMYCCFQAFFLRILLPIPSIFLCTLWNPSIFSAYIDDF